jgi:hypothetical protein
MPVARAMLPNSPKPKLPGHLPLFAVYRVALPCLARCAEVCVLVLLHTQITSPHTSSLLLAQSPCLV